MDSKSVRTVLSEYAQSRMSEEQDLWPAIQRQVLDRENIRLSKTQRSRLVALPRLPIPASGRRLLVFGALAIILVAFGLVWFLTLSGLANPAPVSAAEVLARADAVSQPGNLAANTRSVRSAHVVVTFRYRNSPSDQFSEGRSEWWDQAPDKSRTETTFRAPDGIGFKAVVGTDGAASYQYIDANHEKEFRLYSKSEVSASMGTDLGTATQQASRIGDLNVYDAVMASKEPVGGRMAYVLELTQKPRIPNAPDRFHAAQYRKKVWIDQQAYLVLREQAWDKDGNLIYESQYQGLEINPNLDPSIFKISPPAGYIVADMRPASADEIDKGWKDVAAKLATPMFRATDYPEWLLPGRPYFEASQGTISQAFTSQTGHGLMLHMVISEGQPSTPSLSAQGWGQGTPVQIGVLQGWKYSRDRARLLIFDREGTRITIYLSANDLAQIQDSLVPIAKSMVAVPKK